ncbi:hypothetical protein V7201_15960 [Bacillus sp. JJ1122]|uniref:hypothetical protein n=1 Tax=Bacillus sp. JJ1122 TaxID=3122951 RepID=UPI002FFE3E44
MYEFQHERERKEKIFKAYIIIFCAAASLSFIYGLFWGNTSHLRLAANFVFSIIIFVYTLKGKTWAIFLLKLSVWMNLLILILMAAVYIIS